MEYQRTENCWSLITGAILLTLTSVATSQVAQDNRIVDDVAYTKAMRLVDIGNGTRLNIHCTGQGGPTVVFEAGLGDSAKAWGLVQPEISKSVMGCAYDRAGLGFSDAASKPGTAENAANNLETLLEAADVPPPYVLVGHSYGGMIIKVFAARNRSKTAGIVFVDASHEDLGAGIFEIDPESQRRNGDYLEKLKGCLSTDTESITDDQDLFDLCVGLPGPRFSSAIRAKEAELARKPKRISAWVSEMTNVWTASADQVRQVHSDLGKIPIVVLTKEPAKPSKNEPVEMRAAKNALWVRVSHDLASMSTKGETQTVLGTGHYIQLDQPAAVVSAIERVLDLSGPAAENE